MQGDSGGPLIVKHEEQDEAVGFTSTNQLYCEDVQVGIVSWGARCAALQV